MTETTEVAAYNIREDNKNEDSLITPQELRELYLFGINLNDADGNEMPDSMLQHYIDAAQEWLETEVPGLTFKEIEIVDEIHDYYVDDYMNFGIVRPFKFPVKSVSRWAIQFPLQTEVLRFDVSWVRVDSVGGQINLVPTEGTLSSIILGVGGSFLPLLYNALDFVPGIIHIDYKIGFDGKNIPVLAKDLIGKKASISLLGIIGDLVLGAGIAAKSISLDGLSQSVNTTASAIYSAYSARITLYQKSIKDDLKKFITYYEGIKFVVA